LFLALSLSLSLDVVVNLRAYRNQMAVAKADAASMSLLVCARTAIKWR